MATGELEELKPKETELKLRGIRLPELDKLIKRLEEIKERISKYRFHRWRFHQGVVFGAENPSFDDKKWKEVDLPVRWEAQKGEVWFRCRVKVPKEVAGIQVEGSKLGLYSPYVSSISMEGFINGEKFVYERYWTDFRIGFTLAENIKPGEEYVITLHFFPKSGWSSLRGLWITFSKVEEVIFDIECFIEELQFAKYLKNSEKYLRIILEKVDIDVDSNIDQILEEIEKARKILEPLSKEAKAHKVHLIGHAHIDLSWLWPWEETLRVIERDFRSILKLMKQYPELHFSQSQAAIYEEVERRFPEIFSELRNAIKEGNWDVTASMWVEPDLNMIGTEALIREFLYALKYLKEKFGIHPEICWNPDTFGHIYTLPQILRGFGIKYYFFSRCGKGYPIFWWIGPEGSKVLSFTSDYNNIITPRNIVDAVLRTKSYGLRSSIFVYGVGDHGGGPTVQDIINARRIMEKKLLPTLIFSKTVDFYREVEKEKVKLPEVRDELNFTFDGCYTTHSDVKKYNRLCERLLREIEFLGVLAGGYNKHEVEKLWKKLLFNQFHDILDGSGVPETYQFANRLYREVVEEGNRIKNLLLERISSDIKFTGEGIPIVVFNILPWRRRDIVYIEIPNWMEIKYPEIFTKDGEKIPCEVEGDHILFVAEVPPLGYNVYYLRKGDDSIFHNPYKDGENKYFQLTIDGKTGLIEELYSKEVGKKILLRHPYVDTQPIGNNLFQMLLEAPHSMSAWIIGEIMRVENLLEGEVSGWRKTPVRQYVKVKRSFMNSEIEQKIILWNELDYIEFETTIDWEEIGNPEYGSPMLKVAFTPMLRNPRAYYEIPFGVIERSTDGLEKPALRWVDISNGEDGFALLNDSKHGYDVCGSTIRLTLLRASYSPDPIPDRGVHKVRYAVYPHKGGWDEGDVWRRGAEFNNPLIGYLVTERKTGGKEPEERSIIRFDPEKVMVSSIKFAERSMDIILRMYNIFEKEVEISLQVDRSIERAVETNLFEEEMRSIEYKGREIRLRFKPHEIKTIKIRFKGG